jgi:hypothetical protein
MPTTTTRSALRTRLKYRLGNREDLGDARLDEWLNAGLLDLAGRLFIRDLEVIDTTKTFTVSSNSVTFPTDMIAVTNIRNTTTDRPLNFLEKSRFRQIKVTDGTPRQWTVIGTTIFLDRNAEATDALSLMGVQNPTWAAPDASPPPVDPGYEYGILLLAALQAFRDIGDTTRAILIEDSRTPNAGEFHVWRRNAKLPPLIQGMADRRQSGVMVDMTGYQVIE